jgi:hypothetical protein
VKNSRSLRLYHTKWGRKDQSLSKIGRGLKPFLSQKVLSGNL